MIALQVPEAVAVGLMSTDSANGQPERELIGDRERPQLAVRGERILHEPETRCAGHGDGVAAAARRAKAVGLRVGLDAHRPCVLTELRERPAGGAHDPQIPALGRRRGCPGSQQQRCDDDGRGERRVIRGMREERAKPAPETRNHHLSHPFLEG